MKNIDVFLGVVAFLVWSRPLGAAVIDLEQSKVVDLSHPYDEETIYWPSSPSRFELKTIHRGKTERGYFYSAFSFCTPEHGGTHIDAPLHFSKKGRPVDQIPLTQLMGLAVVVDVRAKAAKDRDYRLSVEDIREWEKKFGMISTGTIVLVHTGWAKRWPKAIEYLGDEKDLSKLHFPSFGEEAIRYLIHTSKVKGVGIDTASIDYGQSKNFPVHQLVGKNNMPAFENLANLDELPSKGATMIALPMKISGGSGGPTRIIALVPKDF